MRAPDSHIYVGRLENGRPQVYVVGPASVDRLDADGTNDVAHALLADATGAEPPEDMCHQFVANVLSKVPRDGFALQRETVNSWLRRFARV